MLNGSSYYEDHHRTRALAAGSVGVLVFLLITIFGASSLVRAQESAKALEAKQPTLSLRKLSDVHADAAKSRLSNPQLFEIRIPDINGEDFRNGRITTTEIESLFVSPSDNIWHLRILETLGGQNSSQANHSLQIERDAFVVKTCDQGYVLPSMKCGLPTGEAEPKQKHLAVYNWKIDLTEIPAILQRANCEFLSHMSVTITTAGRIRESSELQDTKVDGGAKLRAADLAGLRDDQAVVEVLGWTQGGVSQRVSGSIIHGGTGQVLRCWSSVAEPVLRTP